MAEPALKYDVAAVVAKLSAEAKAQGLSEGGLCTRAGLPRNLLAQKRQDGKALSADSLDQLCLVLGKSVKWALGAAGKEG